MNIVELREKNIDELHKIADDLKAEIHQKKMDVVVNSAKDHATITKNKKKLAQILTVIAEKNN